MSITDDGGEDGVEPTACEEAGLLGIITMHQTIYLWYMNQMTEKVVSNKIMRLYARMSRQEWGSKHQSLVLSL